MKKCFCDIKKCTNEAMYTLMLPRNVNYYAHGGIDNAKLMRFSKLDCRETDLCEFHANRISKFFVDIEED